MSRLFLKLYAWCFAMFVVTSIVSLAGGTVFETPPLVRIVGRDLRYPATKLAAVIDDEARLADELRLVREGLDAPVAVYDLAGALRGATSDAPITCAEPPTDRFEFESGRFAVPLVDGDRRVGWACFEPDVWMAQGWWGPLLSTVLVLLCTGASAILLHRSLAVPLRRLSTAATSMAQGDLSVRIRMHRDDEFGRTAAAFDDMADRVETSLRAQRELVAAVSHELRTPLSRMQLALDLAPASMATDPTFDELRHDVEELKQLVARVLEACRPGPGSLLGSREFAAGGSRTPVDLGRLVQRKVDAFARLQPTRTIALELEPQPMQCEGDEALLSSLLDNLLDNACKFSAPEDPVEVRLSRDGEIAVLEVEDRGVGMGSEELGRVFEPFFRADPSRSRETGGFGLGLTLVKRIADAHQAEVSIASHRDEGTTVTVRFPVGCSDRSLDSRPSARRSVGNRQS